MVPDKKHKEDADLMDILAVVGQVERDVREQKGYHEAGYRRAVDAEQKIEKAKSMIVQFRDRKLVKDKDER